MWCIPVIPAIRRLRQKDHKFEASMDCTGRPCLKKKPSPGTDGLVILATPEEAEMRRIEVQSQTGQIVPETLS
jgi:hypothetical protein